jgi:hypothetical protein
MSKGERMESHTERTEGDHPSAQNFPPNGAMEKATHRVANLERFTRFTTRRVLNYGDQLKLQLQTFCISAILAL